MGLALRRLWRARTLIPIVVGGTLLTTAAGVGAAGSAHRPAATTSPPIPPHARTYPPGLPAIQPRATGVDVAHAAFAEADVRGYLQSHHYFFRTTDGSTPQVAKILFVPSSQASAQMHGESTERPDTTLVCFVELHGSFSLSSMHRPYGDHRADNGVAHIGQILFDAQTGNLLVWGFAG